MQSGTNSIWQRVRYLVLRGGLPIIYISGGGWLLIHGFSNYQAAVSFRDKTLSTTGIITQTTIQGKLASSGLTAAPPSHISTIQFKTEQGKVAEFRASDICQDYQLNSCDGKGVQVLYASDNPQLAMVKGGFSPIGEIKQEIGWGSFMTLTGIIMLITEYRERFNLTGA